jgi:hypothetical protein
MPTPEYIEIPLTQGQFARISVRACEHSLVKWYALKRKHGGFYAVRKVMVDGKKITLYLHREVLGIPPGDPRTGDHINHDTLDNRDENLRVASLQEQQYNKKLLARNKCGLKGVSWDSLNKKWTSHISANKKQKNLGRFPSKEEAYAAYCTAAKQFHGDFAKLK